MYAIFLILATMTFISPETISQVYDDNLDSIKWLTDDTEKVERINEMLTPHIAKDFSLIPEETFTAILGLRKEICHKNLDGCFTLKPWMEWSCLKNADSSDKTQVLWKSVVESLPGGGEALVLLKAISSCAKTYNHAKAEAQFQLFVGAHQKSWRKAKNGALDSLLAEFPSAANESAMAQLTNFIWTAYQLEGIDFSDLMRMVDFGGKILSDSKSELTDSKRNLANAIVFVWDRSSSSEENKIVKLIEHSIQSIWKQKNPPSYALDWAIRYCNALKKMGRPEKCETLFKTYFKNSQDLRIPLALHTNTFDSGLKNAGLKGITELAQKSIELKSADMPWIFLRKATMETSIHKTADAAVSLKRHRASLPAPLDPLDAIYANMLDVIILREQKKYSEADKMIKTLRTEIERRAKGKFLARLYLEYHSLLLSLHSGNQAEADKAAKRVEALLPNTFYDLALRAYQNVKKGQKPTAEYAKLKALFGEKFPLLEELDDALKKMKPAG